MNVVERSTRRIDAFQQRHTPTAFLFAVLKKYGDDNAGALVIQLTYTMFVTVFPLLLLLITILGIVLANDPAARLQVEHSAFGEFPIVGPQLLARNISSLKRDSTFGLAVGIIGLLYGSTGLAQSGLYTMAQVWNIPGAIRPNYLARLGRSLLFLLLLAVGLVITTALSGFGTFGHHNLVLGDLAEVAAAAVNVGLYAAAFRILTPKQVQTRWLIPGVVVGGLIWTVVQAFGGYVVGHDLKGASATYGMFGLVLGLIAWIYLGAEVTVYAAEINTVIHRRLWPRAMVQPPLTEADQRSIALQSLQNQRRPEQDVETSFHQKAMTEDEYRRRDYEVDLGVGHSDRVPRTSPPETETTTEPDEAAESSSPVGHSPV